MDVFQSTLTSIGDLDVKQVSDVSAIIRGLLDDRQLQEIWVEGEVTNYIHHKSGHRYFSLSEHRHGNTYVIHCAMWRSYARDLSFEPSNGTKILVWGSVEVYEPQGKIQMIVRDMRRAGAGEKHLLVQRWKEELAAEGLFDPARKRSIPIFPGKVGLVTSLDGAARRDVEQVIARRFPVEIIISPTAVQGEWAHRDIARAIKAIDGQVDVIIVGRGGGSFEDLFAFNHPDVVRAIASCSTPVVSAVGHETDVTLSDFAADLRAPTPSAAAELVVPDRGELRLQLGQARQRIKRGMAGTLSRHAEILEKMRFGLRPRLFQRQVDGEIHRVADLEDRLTRGIRSFLERERWRIKHFRAHLETISPYLPLTHGYSLVRKDEEVVTSIKALGFGDIVTITFSDGECTAEIKGDFHAKEI
jgi:exodeoxyribonuclease VII large subunit